MLFFKLVFFFLYCCIYFFCVWPVFEHFLIIYLLLLSFWWEIFTNCLSIMQNNVFTNTLTHTTSPLIHLFRHLFPPKISFFTLVIYYSNEKTNSGKCDHNRCTGGHSLIHATPKRIIIERKREREC